MRSLAIASSFPFSGRWRDRSCWLLSLATAGVLLIAACSSVESTVGPAAVEELPSTTESPSPEPAFTDEGSDQAPRVAADEASVSTDADAEATPAAAALAAAPTLEELQQQRTESRAEAQPVGLVLPSLEIDAPITPVGVEANGEMEIPGASEVGWYRFGPKPGEEGSAVLAAHVDFNGEIGVFFDLRDGQVGETIDVEYSDGSVRSFVVTERNQFDKTELPFDEIFRRDGAPSLVLITCGGDFNPSLRSYEDNVVLFAEPVSP